MNVTNAQRGKQNSWGMSANANTNVDAIATLSALCLHFVPTAMSCMYVIPTGGLSVGMMVSVMQVVVPLLLTARKRSKMLYGVLWAKRGDQALINLGSLS